MSSSDRLAGYKVHAIRELKRQERREEARHLLDQVAKQVQPILRSRQWTVPLLREFFPRNPNLLGLNKNGGRGKTMEINIRLRYHHSVNAFYPYEEILGTMLHEITHNVRGPHDAQFYKILDEITTECEQLMAQGVTGTGVGFDGPSMGRLGSYSSTPSHDPPRASLREIQLKAAEKRAAHGALGWTGPRRVGSCCGGVTLKHLSPQQAAAQAAERRRQDDMKCFSAITGGNITIDLIEDEEEDDCVVMPSTRTAPISSTTIYDSMSNHTTKNSTPKDCVDANNALHVPNLKVFEASTAHHKERSGCGPSTKQKSPKRESTANLAHRSHATQHLYIENSSGLNESSKLNLVENMRNGSRDTKLAQAGRSSNFCYTGSGNDDDVMMVLGSSVINHSCVVNENTVLENSTDTVGDQKMAVIDLT